MANTYKNIVITPNTGSTIGDPAIVFSGGDTNTNTNIILTVYPTSNGTLSFDGSAGQLFSIENDLSNTVFSVNDISGIPLILANVVTQQVAIAPIYSNVAIGTFSTTYKLEVNGSANIGSPVFIVAGSNVTSKLSNTRQLLASYVANNSSTISSTNIFNGYQDYEIIVNNLVPTVNGSILELQWYANAGYQSSGYITYSRASQSGTDTYTSPTTYIDLSGGARCSNTVKIGTMSSIILTSAHNTNTAKQHIFNSSGLDANTSTAFIVTGGGYLNLVGANVTGFQLFMSSGNILTGNVKVYGTS
jgi:hypothetical protein